MVNVAEGTLNEVDVIMWLVEPTTYIGAGEQHIAELLSKVKTPVILAINKIDTVKDEEIIAKAIDTYKNVCPFAEIGSGFCSEKPEYGQDDGAAVSISAIRSAVLR